MVAGLVAETRVAMVHAKVDASGAETAGETAAETVAETVDVMARGIASRTGTAIKVAMLAVMVAGTVPLPSKSQ